MRSVILLALLWQTAVVVGLGAIHAPNTNKYDGGATLPWVGTQVWSTEIKGFNSLTILTPLGSRALIVKGPRREAQPTSNADIISLDTESGNVQWRQNVVGLKAFTDFANELPFVATASMDGANVFAVNSSAGTVESIWDTYPKPPNSYVGSILGSNDQFFWFTTNTETTTMTKINPRNGVASASTGIVPFSYRSYAGPNYLYSLAQTSHTLTCFSAVTGEVAWTVTSTVYIRSVVPSLFNDVVLLFFSNSTFSLFYAPRGGNWMWTSPVGSYEDGNAFFTSDTVLIKSSLGVVTSFDLTSSSVLWSGVMKGTTEDRYNCILESNNILVSFVQPSATLQLAPVYYMVGVHTYTGVTMFNYTIDLGNKTVPNFTDGYTFPQIRCAGSRVVYFSVIDNRDNSIVQSIWILAHRP